MSGVWLASYLMMWAAVVVLGLAVVALLRQVGVLHARLRPLGAHFAGEGPERLAPAPGGALFPYRDAAVTLLAFTSPACTICAALAPGLRALRRQYADLVVHEIAHGPTTAAVFAAFNVASTPYFVTVDRAGVVQARGVANTLEQIEVLVEESLVDRARGGR